MTLVILTIDLLATIRETTSRTFDNDLSREISDGARFMRVGAEASITASRYGLEDNPVSVNLDFADAESKSEPKPFGA